MSKPGRDLPVIDRMYQQMEALLDEPEELLRMRTSVSGWSVAEQLDHVLFANKWALSTVIAMLRGHGEFPTSGRLTLLGVALLRAGRIPRGRARAPATSIPKPSPSIPELRAQLRKQMGYLATIRADSLRVAALKTRFPHPYFGLLSAVDGLRFVRVHSDHHLRIVRDILESVKP